MPSVPMMRAIGRLHRPVAENLGEFDHIGVAVPGLIAEKRARSRIRHIFRSTPTSISPRICGQKPAVRTMIENDANAAAYGEFRLGAGRGSENIFYATLGRGRRRRAYTLTARSGTVASGFAGEFGYVAVNSDGHAARRRRFGGTTSSGGHASDSIATARLH